jgi:hypothetical protein
LGGGALVAGRGPVAGLALRESAGGLSRLRVQPGGLGRTPSSRLPRRARACRAPLASPPGGAACEAAGRLAALAAPPRASRRGRGRDEAPRRASVAPSRPPRPRPGAHSAAGGGRAGSPARPPLGAAAAERPRGGNGPTHLRPRLQCRGRVPSCAAAATAQRRRCWWRRCTRRRTRRWRWEGWCWWARRWGNCLACPPSANQAGRLELPAVRVHQFCVSQGMPALWRRGLCPGPAGPQCPNFGGATASAGLQVCPASSLCGRGQGIGGALRTTLVPCPSTSGTVHWRRLGGQCGQLSGAGPAQRAWAKPAAWPCNGPAWPRRRRGPR